MTPQTPDNDQKTVSYSSDNQILNPDHIPKENRIRLPIWAQCLIPIVLYAGFLVLINHQRRVEEAEAPAKAREVALAKVEKQKQDAADKAARAAKAEKDKEDARLQANDDAKQDYARTCRNPALFYQMAQDIIRPTLKAPKSAEFASFYDDEIRSARMPDMKDGTCGWTILAYVDSDNSFGAHLRKHFVVSVRRELNSPEFRIVKLAFN